MKSETSKKNIEAVDTGFIRAEVGRRQITYKAIAEAMGIPPEELSRKVNDRIPFQVWEVESLADCLGCSADQILGRA